MIKIQVVYILPQQPVIIDEQVDDDCNVLHAIQKSNILSLCKISLDNHTVGIYGKSVELTDMLNEGERIEIYRPLINDPKEIRRRRAALHRHKKKT